MDFKNTKGQIVGTLRDGVYRRKARSSKHLLKVMDAWGIDQSIHAQLMWEDCQEIRILDMDEDVIYSVDMKTFSQNAILHEFDNPQMFLPSRYWTKEPRNINVENKEYEKTNNRKINA